MPQEETTDVQVVEEKKGKLAFGVGQLNNPTPMWAIWVFRIEFLANKAFGVWMASQSSLTLDQLKNLVLWATIIDGFVWGVGKFLGVKKEDLDTTG